MENHSTKGVNTHARQKNEACADLVLSGSESSFLDRSSIENRSAYTDDDESTVYTNSVGNSTEASERKINRAKSSDSDESEFNFRKIIGHMFACGNDISKDEAITIDDRDDDRSIFSASSKYSIYSKKVSKSNDDDTIINSNLNDSDEQSLSQLDEMMSKLRVKESQTGTSMSQNEPEYNANMTQDDIVDEDISFVNKDTALPNNFGDYVEEQGTEMEKARKKHNIEEREIFDLTEVKIKNEEEDGRVQVDMEIVKNKTDGSGEKVEEEDNVIAMEEILKDLPYNEIDFDKEPSPLYRAIDTRSWKKAYKILRKSPREASIWVFRRDEETDGYKWMFLPIHVACFSGAPLGLVIRLVRACPQGLRMGANGGKSPLHIACETLADSTVITFLHGVYPEALYAVDEAGNTPLQEAMFCQSKSGRARVMKLLAVLTAKDCAAQDHSDDENNVPTTKSVSKLKMSQEKMSNFKRPISMKRGTRSEL